MIRQAAGEVRASMRNGTPTFETHGRWVALASRKHHLAVHLCASDSLARIRARHPEFDCGVACVRIRDRQYVPIYELRAAFVAIFCDTADTSRVQPIAIDASTIRAAEAVK